MRIKVVIDLESGDRQVLGEYAGSEEDGVSYWREDDGTLEWVGVDLVEIVDGFRDRRGSAVELPTLGRLAEIVRDVNEGSR